MPPPTGRSAVRRRADGSDLLRGQATRGGARFLCRALPARSRRPGQRRPGLPDRGQAGTCRPSEKTAEDPDGCGDKLGCLRTNLTRDEGVCLAMKVCSSDGDCDDPALPTCGSTVLKALLPNAPFMTTNLQCVVGGCKAGKTSCPLGETCLPSVAPSTTAVPDLCVPSCDSELNCPPNYACWRRVSGAGAPAVCIPTLPERGAQPLSTAGPGSAWTPVRGLACAPCLALGTRTAFPSVLRRAGNTACPPEATRNIAWA